MLQRLYGNEALKNDLAAALTAGHLPHSILLCGAPGLGKNYAARLLAADYLYPQGGQGAETVLLGQNPECITAAPQGAADIIPVDRVREVRAAVRSTSLSAEGRVAIIQDAQKMQAAAANALLKVLEEPPAGVLFVLTADSEAAILPTIRSRCAVYTLTPLTAEECAGVLRQGDVSAGDAAFLAAAYGGALGDCLAAAGDAQRMEVLRGAARFVGLGAAKDRFGLLAEATRIEGKTKREEAESFLADLAQLYAAALDGRAVPGLPALSRQDAARALPAVFEAQRRLRGGSAKLVSTLLALRIAPPAEA